MSIASRHLNRDGPGTIGFTLRDPDGYFVTVNAI